MTVSDTFPGLWDVSVGGHFTAGDTSLETACKEVREEVGLECDADSLRFVCTLSTSARGSVPLTGDFICNEYKVKNMARLSRHRCCCSRIGYQALMLGGEG